MSSIAQKLLLGDARALPCSSLTHLITRTHTPSRPSPSIAARIGRPAVPPGSPSSLERYCCPTLYAQQLWLAAGSRAESRRARACERWVWGYAWCAVGCMGG